MALVCSILGHSEAPSAVSNQGYQFSTCTRCGMDLIQSGEGNWIAPPKGFRIVQKKNLPLPQVQEAPAVAEIPAEEKRKAEDRRAGNVDTRPASLQSFDRRRSDRRGFGNYLANRRKGLIANSD